MQVPGPRLQVNSSRLLHSGTQHRPHSCTAIASSRGRGRQHEQVKELLMKGRDKWSQLPNKRSTLIAIAGLIPITWVANAAVDAVERVPLFKDLLVLIGLSYSTVFFWRYVLFYEGRKKLEAQITGLYCKAVELSNTEEQSGRVSSKKDNASTDFRKATEGEKTLLECAPQKDNLSDGGH